MLKLRNHSRISGRSLIDMSQRACRPAKTSTIHLRLDVQREATERGVYLTPDGEMMAPVVAPQAVPNRLPMPPVPVPPGATFIHSHPAQGPLSLSDVNVATRLDLDQVIAVTPQGSVFIAKPHPERLPEMPKSVKLYHDTISMPWAADRLGDVPARDKLHLIEQGRLLWLDRLGHISYDYRATGAMCDLFDHHAGFFEELLRDVDLDAL